MKKKVLKAVKYLCLAAVSVVVLFFAASWIFEWRPAVRETLYENRMPRPLPDTLTILTWNIGYAGLGSNMDFFYDGGRRVRDGKERSALNFTDIIRKLEEINADIMLLQEVDTRSHRSYGVDQAAELGEAFPGYTATVGYNYRAWVPIPLGRPIGKVQSGVMILSKFEPYDIVRYNYPSKFNFPVRLFNLKRGLLASRFLTHSGDTVMINNTHNTAYDTGGMRTREMQFLSCMLLEAASRGTSSITGGDWNQYPPSYKPDEAELGNKYFVPEKIEGKDFERFAEFVYDADTPSLRYLDKPYEPGDVTTLTDFFLVSRGIRVLSIETLDFGFESSDHNPVLLKIVL